MGADTILSLTIESRWGEVRYVAAMVRRICKEWGVPKDLIGLVELVVVEAANNAIKHAYHEKPGNLVEVELKREPGRLVIDISDWGETYVEEFPSLSRRPLFDPQDRAGVQEGGLGLYIINQVMDQALRSRNGPRNTLTMIKEIPGL